MEKKELTFEDALGRLEGIVKKLEKPDLPLEESIKLFEEGMGLSKICSERLDQAQQRVELLQKEASGAMKSVPFDEEKGSGQPAKAARPHPVAAAPKEKPKAAEEPAEPDSDDDEELPF
jgi:exodeoxyribonuclease VII small subunit